MDIAPNERDRLKPQEEEEKNSELDNHNHLLPFGMYVPTDKSHMRSPAKISSDLFCQS